MNQIEIDTRRAAGEILSIAAESGSASIDKFSTWLMVGLAAFFSLILTEIKSGNALEGFGEEAILGSRFFLASCAAGFIARYLAAIVSGTAASRAAADKYKAPGEIDVDLFVAEIVRGYHIPVRWLVQWSMSKFLAGLSEILCVRRS
ncbi:MAG: hypothetical protein HYV17_00700 [Xanthomonadales bacterium]|nr:hypothetical protein [Xanthomonadales bacterium]